MVQVKGEGGLNELRDKARAISEKLGMQSEFEKLNKLISSLLTTHPSKILSSPLALAKAFGNPYDPGRLPLFEKLFIELKQQEFKDLPEKMQPPGHSGILLFLKRIFPITLKEQSLSWKKQKK